MSKISAATFASLFGSSVQTLFALTEGGDLSLGVNGSFEVFSLQDFSYLEALEIEVASQLADDDGIPLAAATLIVNNAGVHGLFEHTENHDSNSKTDSDFWIGLSRERNTWNAMRSRGSMLLTGFGASEYWSSGHFSGNLKSVMQAIADYYHYTESRSPDSDPGRIILANVSAADRRLRRRAAELGINITVSGDFA